MITNLRRHPAVNRPGPGTWGRKVKPSQPKLETREAVPEKYQKRWRQSNEERMLLALGRLGRLSLRIRFEVRADGNHWFKLAGKDVKVVKIPNQGKLLQVVDEVGKALKRKVGEL